MQTHATPRATPAAVLSLLLITAATTNIDAAAGGALVKNEWSKLAKFTKHMAKVPARARRLIEQRYGALKRLQLYRARAAAYTKFSGDNNTEKTWQPIQIAIAQELDHLANDFSTKTQEAIEAAASAEFVRGGITEFFEVAAKAYGAANSGCLTTAANTGDAAANEVSNIQGLAADGPDINPPTTSGGETEIEGIGPAGFEGLATTTGLGDDALSAAANCNLFKAASGGIIQGRGIAAKMYFALGYLGKDPTDATGTPADGTNLNQVPDTAATRPLRYYKAAYDAVKKLKHGASFAPEPLDPTKITSLKNSHSFKTAVKNVLLGQDGDYTGSDEPAVTNKINQVYKQQDSDFQQQFWGKLEQVDVPKEAGGGPNTKLSQMQSLDKLQQALQYFTHQRETILINKINQLQSAAAAKAEKSQTAENKEKVCNAAGDDASKCKALEKEGCVFNEQDKKCELKKDVKEKLEKTNQETGADGKTTNATASNSFVIKKARLLLAVLLF
ncbi:Trypanosome variant surface glycoprotein (A-type), putative [Trypanosoma equiperdum]|uniref:Trypanosome variant surface glycoprotein (A-type), putative n=1 Tax=Trypanosoma equiperdum TaxID=5694 RepID=A0A1G4IC82_TRYEQ|nr:Trypanosome variant surface glycoprotein (A-type), putative [Trypanosoma equiperdum]